MADIPNDTTTTAGGFVAYDDNGRLYGYAGGILGVGGDRDWFRNYAEAGHTYTIFAHMANTEISPDVALVLYDPSGVVISSAGEDDGVALDAALTFVAAVTGVHYIEVRVSPVALNPQARGLYEYVLLEDAGIVQQGTAGADINPVMAAGQTYLAGAGDDVVTLAAGYRNLLGDAGSDRLTGNATDNSIFGGLGEDFLFGASGRDVLVGGSGDDWIEGGPDNDTLLGGQGSDMLFGGEGDDTLYAEDVFDGAPSAGANVLVGGNGSDAYNVRSAADVVDETGTNGYDTVYSEVSADLNDTSRFKGDIEDLFVHQVNGSLTGNNLANRLYATEGNNLLDGRGGSDELDGGDGNDTYVLGAEASGVDAVIDSAGIDTITSTIDRSLAFFDFSEIENLTLLGSAFSGTGNGLANVLTGNTSGNLLDGGIGNDTLDGGAGNDTIIGNVGKDTLTGGLHNDIFKFTNKTHSRGSTMDIITDFDDRGRGNDRIDVSALFGPRMTYIHDDAFTKAGQVRIKDIAGPDVIVEVNTGGSLAADFSIRLKGTALVEMTAGDFVL
ncbi:MAG: calcium-binding protein [Rhizobiaceae bacterium]|nr:calcium-binding protein [Rhizobiaceae bacterium]